MNQNLFTGIIYGIGALALLGSGYVIIKGETTYHRCQYGNAKEIRMYMPTIKAPQSNSINFALYSKQK